MKTIQEQIKVMEHFSKGGKVEVQYGSTSTWKEINIEEDSFNWYHHDYRIVEEKKTVTIEKWLCKDLSRNYSIVIETDNIDDFLKFNYSESMCKDKLLETYKVEL